MSHTIEVEHVSKAYGDVKALVDVSLHVKDGEVFGLLGPNGAGKTTLVRILTTLLHPDQGKLTVAEVDVLQDPMRIRKMIGLAGQYPAVDEYLTGRENLVMVGQLYRYGYKKARQRADELLERFSLVEAANRPVKTYSGGMRRRLDLAASIVSRPQVLFLDEPTTGLDPRTRKNMWETIRELVRDGTTLMLTTQYLEEADVLADRIAVIDRGALIAEGTPNELKSRMGSDVLELRVEHLQQVAQVAASLEDLGADKPQVNTDTGLITLPVADGAQSLMAVVRRLDETQVAITDLSLRRPSLDDVFLAITGSGVEQ